jgi:hypothetical protein
MYTPILITLLTSPILLATALPCAWCPQVSPSPDANSNTPFKPFAQGVNPLNQLKSRDSKQTLDVKPPICSPDTCGSDSSGVVISVPGWYSERSSSGVDALGDGFKEDGGETDKRSQSSAGNVDPSFALPHAILKTGDV